MERATVDLRFHVTAETRRGVYDKINAFLETCRATAPDGIDIRHTTLRKPHPLASVQPTVWRENTHA